MSRVEDPLVEVDNEIKELRQKLQKAKAKRSALQDERSKWPKLVSVSISKGECGEEMLEAFAEACGWIADEHSTGTYGWTYICAQAWLYYEVTENGQVTLVGAYDQAAGAIGKTDCDPNKGKTSIFPRDDCRDC